KRKRFMESQALRVDSSKLRASSGRSARLHLLNLVASVCRAPGDRAPMVCAQRLLDEIVRERLVQIREAVPIGLGQFVALVLCGLERILHEFLAKLRVPKSTSNDRVEGGVLGLLVGHLGSLLVVSHQNKRFMKMLCRRGRGTPTPRLPRRCGESG